MKRPRLVDSLIRVRSEIVSLRLQQVRREAITAITVEVTDRRREPRNRQAKFHGRRHHMPPAGLGFFDRRREEIVKQQVFEVGLFLERVLDVLQERFTPSG